MTLTAQQRQTTQRVDLGGDALEALQALRPTLAPRSTKVTVTTGQLSLSQLIAAARASESVENRKILATTRKVTLLPHSLGIYFTTRGEACSASTGTPMEVRSFEIDGTAESLARMKFYAADVAMTIIEEG